MSVSESSRQHTAVDPPAGRRSDGGGSEAVPPEQQPVVAPAAEPHPPRHVRGAIDRVVFGVTGALALAFVVWGFADSGSLGTASASGQSWVIENTGWFFVVAASFFVIVVLFLAVSRYGRIPLGHDGEAPEFRTVSWIAMMFSAGMGIGLMFWGVAEPLSHYVSPPPGTTEAQTDAALQTAMATTLFHWTLHPWAIYAVVGLAVGYGVFRRGRPQLISAAFGPLLGKRSEGPIGRVIDILAIVATLFGSAASLGLGTLQIGAGLEFNGWIGEVGTPLLVGIIAVLTVAFVASAVSGVAKGIQWLSNINMVLALVLALFVFLVGPTLLILNLVPTALGDYADQLAAMASRTDASGDDDLDAWLSGWTIFYWAWWVSWTPFVGLFIARISRGRTIRQFVTGVLLVPSLVSLVWFAIFGGSAINEQATTGELVGEDGAIDSTNALFTLLGQYPLAAVASVLVMVLVAIFFVSGADAASIVMGSLSERGAIEPRRPTVVFWGALTGAVAAIMLIIGGGTGDALTGLQNLTIIAALPFVVVMVLLCVSLWKDLRSDPLMVRDRAGAALVTSAVVNGQAQHEGPFDLVTSRRATGEEPAPPAAG